MHDSILKEKHNAYCIRNKNCRLEKSVCKSCRICINKKIVIFFVIIIIIFIRYLIVWTIMDM